MYWKKFFMSTRRDPIIAELKNNEEEIIDFFKRLNSEQLGMTLETVDPAVPARVAAPLRRVESGH